MNAMLDKAEDPEKLIRLMIREMEDTLVEMKSSCAQAMAQDAQQQRLAGELDEQIERWTQRAELAAEKGKEDLAREALLERKAAVQRRTDVGDNAGKMAGIVAQYRKDIAELEAKIAQARKKHVVLVQRHRQAEQRKKAQSGIRTYDSAHAMAKFEDLEARIDRAEADASLINVKSAVTEDAFYKLERDEEVERELTALLEKRAEKRVAQ